MSTERLEGIELILRCREIFDTAKKCQEEDGLAAKLKSIGEKVKVYTFKQRLKPPTSIEKKVRRKRREGDLAESEHKRQISKAEDARRNSDGEQKAAHEN